MTGQGNRQTPIRACVIGWPIGHSRSPIIHKYWLERYGIDGGYEKKGVRPEEFPEFAKNLALHGFAGCSVTIPHKAAAFAIADRRDGAAMAVGAANLLWLADGQLWASNTDTYGFVANLDDQAPKWREAMDTALVIGAGGAARAVVHGLREEGVACVRVANRTFARATEICASFGEEPPKGAAGRVCRLETVAWDQRHAAVASAGLIVNTTSLGMTGQPELELPLDDARVDATVADIVYAPLETPLLAQAKSQGLAVVDGLGMLLHQAVPHFEKWFGVRPEVTGELRALLVSDITGRT
ncbi:MAG TPA: shikimate dehydrogenase [Hyphomicrobiaceae bacterium]|nr:shikimate dehydrogenase [Hyphomicrobiaceae bacterium]